MSLLLLCSRYEKLGGADIRRAAVYHRRGEVWKTRHLRFKLSWSPLEDLTMRSYTALAEPDVVWLISDTCLGPTNLCCLCQQSSINWLNSLFFICSLSFNNININIDVTEAPFMVKFEITIFFFFKHSRNNPWGKYLKLSQTFNSTLFLLSSKGGLCISSPKNVSGIFGCW